MLTVASVLDTVRWLLEVQNMGLMSKVIMEWLQPSVSLASGLWQPDG